MKRPSVFPLLILSLTSAAFAAQERRVPRIAVLTPESYFDFIAAARTYEGKLQVDVFGTAVDPLVRSAKGVALGDYDLVFAVGGGSQFPFLADALDAAKARTKVLVMRSDLVSGNLDAASHPWLDQYRTSPTVENLRRLLAYLGTRFLAMGLPVEPPVEYPISGFYYPGAPGFFNTVDDFRTWYGRTHPRAAATSHSIGVVFNRLDYIRGQTTVVDALIREIEANQHVPVPFMFSGGMPLGRLLGSDGRPAVDVVITTSSRIDWQNTEAGIAAARHLTVPILQGVNHYRLTPEAWQASPTGLSPDLSFLLAMAERDGLIEPVVISARRVVPGGSDTKAILPAQVAWLVRRAVRWAALHQKPNSEKRVVVTFHAEGGGKGDVGGDLDHYMDVQGSLVEIMAAMRKRGYDLGSGPLPDLKTVSRDLSRRASNIGNWAPGEIARRVAAGDVELIPEETYTQWFHELPAEKQQQVIAAWGPPPGRIMVHSDAARRRFLVMPRLTYGNLLVVPHPDWGQTQDQRAMFARTALPPHHQYIAFFLWLRKQKKPDAWLNLFSNLVLQGGKMEGPAVDDWTALLQGDIPHIQPTPLHGNAGISGKRRTLAVTPTFTPAIVYSDLYGDLLELQDKLRRYRDQEEGALRESYARSIRDEAVRLHLDHDLEINAKQMPIEQLVGQLERYLADIRKQHMPAGTHVLGVAPAAGARLEMVTAMLGPDFVKSLATHASDAHVAARQLVAAVINDRMSPSAAQQKVLGHAAPSLDRALALAADYAARLDKTPQELEKILDVLDGRYLEPGPINDPVRNPDVLPPGRNSYMFDPSTLPTREAWTTAITLANQLIKQYREKHGAYPRKVGFVLWSSESSKNLGVSEAQMLYLLGVRPVWSSSGRVVDVELIPASELGRPRIDVFATASGLYRDHFLDKMLLLDKAVKLAASAKETDNRVAAGTAEVRAALRAAGESAQTADALATARIFSESVGSYSPNIQFLTKSGDFMKSDSQVTELYTSRMSHVYSADGVGKFNRHAFNANLKSLEAVSFSRSSNVLGTLEHPMVAAYFGGLSMAGRAVSGKSADMFVANLADPAAANTETLSRYLNRELRSRYFNPKWVSHMMAQGYDGSRFAAAFTSNLHLWDVTTPNLVTSEHWGEARDVYIRDKYKLGLDAFFEENNPFAKQAVAATLLDAAARGEWKATAAEKTEVARALAQSAAAHGLACEADLCRNRALVGQMRETLTASAETAPLFHQFQAALDTMAPPGPLSAAPAIPAQTQAARGARGSAKAPAPSRASTAGSAASPAGPAPAPQSAMVQGKVIEPASPPPASPRSSSRPLAVWLVGAFIILGLMAIGWWRGGSV